MTLSIDRAIEAFSDALDTVRRFGPQVAREVTRRLQSDGLPALRSAVPVVTGRLQSSFRIRVTGGVVQIGSTDPAAPYIRYRQPGAYGATTVQGTLEAWARAELPGIVNEAVRVVSRRLS